MIVALVVVACTLAIAGAHTWVAWTVLVFICIYIAAYAWCAFSSRMTRLSFLEKLHTKL